MKKQETGKINLSIVLFVIVLIIILVIAYFIYNIYTDKKALNEKIQELGNTISSLQNTVHTLEASNSTTTTGTNRTNTTNSTTTNHSENNTILKDISYIEIEMLVDNAQNEGPTYNTKKVTDQAIIANIKDIINNATNYTSDEAYGLPEDSPKLYIYQTDGNKISIIVEDLESINNIGVWTKQDASDKTFYRVDAKLAPYLKKVYKETN